MLSPQKALSLSQFRRIMMRKKNKTRYYLLALLLLMFVAIELPILVAGHLAKPMPSDTIIVLGAKLIGREPSTMLRLRLDEAIRLYKLQYAPAIIVSGAQGYDEEISEASAMQDYLIRQGIPAAVIFTEDQSRSTFQNLANSSVIMRSQNFNSAIIVSNVSHIRRALVLANQLEMNATGSPAPMADNVYLTTKQYIREGAAMLSLVFVNPR